jgi:hypothetical protein
VPLTWVCNSCGGKYSDTRPGGYTYGHSCPSEIRNDAGELVPTPNPRNENVAVNRQGLEVGIVAEGEGTRCLTDSTLKEPKWISETKSRIAKREGD